MPKGRSNIKLQTLLDAGLNAFAVELLAESINGHRHKELLRKPFSFTYDDVVFTLSLAPEHDWTLELLLEILRPIAATTLDTYLAQFARAFGAADETERPFLVHVALLLIDKYSLWPPAQPTGDQQPCPSS